MTVSLFHNSSANVTPIFPMIEGTQSQQLISGLLTCTSIHKRMLSFMVHFRAKVEQKPLVPLFLQLSEIRQKLCKKIIH